MENQKLNKDDSRQQMESQNWVNNDLQTDGHNPPENNKRAVGTKYEQMACAYIEEEGMQVIETNYRTRIGEIDIIAWDREELVFLEVKYRKNRNYGGAESAIPRQKQKTIMQVAKIFMKMHGIKPNSFIRFDAVLIDGTEIMHIKNAWQA